MYVISPKGISLIKEFEGFSEKSYKDIAGIWTIGYGSTRIENAAVYKGLFIDELKATELLEKTANEFLSKVEKYINVPLNQNQIDAIASFIYNVGVGNFIKSTLLKKLNQGDYDGAGEQFLSWNKSRINGELTPVAGLTRRREAEQALFNLDDGR